MTQTQPTVESKTMTKDEFNARRNEIYTSLVREAHAAIKAKGECARGRITQTAKAVATRKFSKMEKAFYSV